MKKHVLKGIVLAGISALLLAGCQSQEESAQVSTAAGTQETYETEVDAEDIDEINMLFYCNMATNSDAVAQVESEINKITEPTINTAVHLNAIEMGSWDQQVNLMISSGEQIDLMPTFFGGSTTFSSMYSQNQLMPLNDLLNEYGSDILSLLKPQYLEATTFGGNIYAVPVNKDNVTNVYYAMRTDILEELNLVDAAQKIESLEDVEAILQKVKENTDLTPLSGTNATGAINVGSQLYEGKFSDTVFYDKFVSDYIVTLSNNPKKVVNLFATDEFKDAAELAEDWYNKGYVYQDIATATDSNYGLISSGKCFSLFFTAEESTCNTTIDRCVYDMTVIKTCSQPIATSAANTITWAIPVTSKAPEAAMKFMNLMYTNEDIINLLNYGIEGVHYIVREDGIFDYPEGVDATTCAYHIESTYLFGNQFLAGIWNGDDPDIRKKAQEINDLAEFSENFGFAADIKDFSMEISSISSAYNEYYKSLMCGTVDADVELEKFNEKLNAAGIDRLVDGVQEQLDLWYEDK